MLVALAVFSLAALALIRLQGITIRTAADLDGKVMAQIVARNLMTEWQTDPAPLSLGQEQGAVQNGGRAWRWTRRVIRTGDVRILRVDVGVSAPDGSSPAALTFLKALQ